MKNIKNINIKSYDETSSLIYSIIFLIIGVVLFTNAANISDLFKIIIASILIILGIIKLISYNRFKKKFEIINTTDLISGIVFITLGLITLIFYNLFLTVIRIIMGSFIVYSGILRLISFLKLKKFNKGLFKYTFILSILMIGCGLYVLFTPNLILKTVGLFIIFYAIIEIIGFIFYSQIEKPNEGQKTIENNIIIEEKK